MVSSKSSSSDNAALERIVEPELAMEYRRPVMASPIRKRDFYRAWLALAFWHSWGKQDSVAGLIGFVFPIIARFIPSWQLVMTDLAWQIPLTVLSALFVTRVALSPYWLYKERDERGRAVETALLQIEKEPKLVGQIHCLFMTTSGNERGEGVRWDCFLIMQLTINNSSAQPTTISGFNLELRWEDTAHNGLIIPLGEWRLLRRFPSPGKPDGSTTFAPVWLELATFPADVQITTANHLTKYLGFYVPGFPLEGVTNDRFHEGVVMTLWARDRKNERHELYCGNPNLLSGCGTIRKAQQRGRFTRDPDGPGFDFENYWEE